MSEERIVTECYLCDGSGVFEIRMIKFKKECEVCHGKGTIIVVFEGGGIDE